MSRTLHLLHAGQYADRTVVGIYPTRAAAEAEIVARVLRGLDGDLLAERASIDEVTLDDDESTRAAAALASMWRMVGVGPRNGVSEECGGLVALLDSLVDAYPSGTLDELRTALAR